MNAKKKPGSYPCRIEIKGGYIEADIIEKKDLPDQIRGETYTYLPDPKEIKTLKEFRELAEKDFIIAKLKENEWNITQTAREIDTPRSNLYKKLEQYDIKITPRVEEVAVPSSLKKGESSTSTEEGTEELVEESHDKRK